MNQHYQNPTRLITNKETKIHMILERNPLIFILWESIIYLL
jgi:hypothetical protein